MQVLETFEPQVDLSRNFCQFLECEILWLLVVCEQSNSKSNYKINVYILAVFILHEVNVLKSTVIDVQNISND